MDWLIQLAVGTVVTGIIALIIHSIKQQNAAQQQQIDQSRAAFLEKYEFVSKQIALLFTKHDEDVERLRSLEMRVAADHYNKPEIDAKVERIEATLRQGFNEMSADIKAMGTRFDKLSEQLVALASNGKHQ